MPNHPKREGGTDRAAADGAEDRTVSRRLSDQVELEVELLSPADGVPAPSPAARTTDANGPRIVLVVDDDADMRRYVRRSLQRPGHLDIRVFEASSGREALTVIADLHPDLVIADVVMPGMDGIELTRSLRLRDDAESIGVLLITGELSWRVTEQRAKEAGAQAVLGKPFNARKLCDVVARLLLSVRELEDGVDEGTTDPSERR